MRIIDMKYNTIPVLQAGFTKSGNMLLYVIIRSMLSIIGLPYNSVICNDKEWQRIKNQFTYNSDFQPEIDVLHITDHELGRYLVSTVYFRTIYNLKKYVNNCSIIWTHDEYVKGVYDELFKLCAPIYIYRDCRAVLNSLAHYLNTDYMKSTAAYNKTPQEYLDNDEYCRGILKAWKLNVLSYLKNDKGRILFIKYEDLVSDKRKWIKKIAKHIGVYHFLNETIVDTIVKKSSPEVMRHNMPEHVRKCCNEDWRAFFSPKLTRICEEEIGDVLHELGYTIEPDKKASLPIPEAVYGTVKDKPFSSETAPEEKKYIQGLELISQGNWENAMRLFSTLEQTDFDRFRLFIGQAQALKYSGNYDKAIEKITNAIGERPYDLNTRIHEALIYSHLKQYGLAIKKLKILEKACPGNLKLMQAIGGVFVASGEYKKALSIFKGLVKKHPEIREFHLNQCDVLRLMGRFTEAFTVLDNLENTMPIAQGGWMTRGKIYQAMEQWDSAYTCYCKEYKLFGSIQAKHYAEQCKNNQPLAIMPSVTE